MRIVNMMLYFAMLIAVGTWYLDWKGIRKNRMGAYVHGYWYLLIILFAVNSISFALTYGKGAKEIVINRQGYSGEETQVSLRLEKGEATEELVLPVQPRQYGKKTIRKKMKEAFAYMDTHVKGNNASLDHVKSDLDFSLDYEKYPFDVEVQPADYSLLDEKGTVHNAEESMLAAGFGKDEIGEGILTTVKVVLSYGEEVQDKTYTIRVELRDKKPVEQLFFEAKQKIIQLEKKAAEEDHFVIPSSLKGVNVERTDHNTVGPMQVLIFGFFLTGLLLFREKEQVREAERIRKQKLLRSYPWFVNEMVLMLGAGMQVKHIFTQMLDEYQRKEVGDDREPLMKELVVAGRGFEIGMPEEQVYYQLGRRLQLPCYIKLMTLLEQNVVRGTKGLTEIFEQEELTALEERKNLTKRYGEEAGTKLLGPMVLLLVIIMLLIMIPAFMSF